MAPDLNSLPPSRLPSGSPLQSRVHAPNMEGLHRRPGSPSPRSSSLSLAASASINAGFQNEDSRRSSPSASHRNIPPVQVGRGSGRRRSTVDINFGLDNPPLPGPDAFHLREQGHPMRFHSPSVSPPSLRGSPTLMAHHQRAPSLGELHQELEQEQEAQVVLF